MTDAIKAFPVSTTLRPPLFPARATVSDWCALSGMSRTSTYLALGAGHLRAIKFGTRTLIDVPHGLAWLDSLPAATFRPARAA